jgi:CubicO group peptidase (beta-lactamase class C family)
MLPLPEAIDAIAAETGFAGVVAVDRRGEIEFAKAYGYAHRAHKIPNTVDTRFAIASGSKGLTALTVVSLIEQDALGLSTTARSVLGRDLPLIGDDVTVGTSWRTGLASVTTSTRTPTTRSPTTC